MKNPLSISYFKTSAKFVVLLILIVAIFILALNACQGWQKSQQKPDDLPDICYIPLCKKGQVKNSVINQKYKVKQLCLGVFRDDFYGSLAIPVDKNSVMLLSNSLMWAQLYDINKNSFKAIPIPKELQNFQTIAEIFKLDDSQYLLYPQVGHDESKYPEEIVLFNAKQNKFSPVDKNTLTKYQRFEHERNKDLLRAGLKFHSLKREYSYAASNFGATTKFDHSQALYAINKFDDRYLLFVSYSNPVYYYTHVWLEDYIGLKRYKPVKLNVPRRQISSIRLKDGSILIMGDSDVIEKYDPETGEIKIVGKFQNSNYSKKLDPSVIQAVRTVLLPDGRIFYTEINYYKDRMNRDRVYSLYSTIIDLHDMQNIKLKEQEPDLKAIVLGYAGGLYGDSYDSTVLSDNIVLLTGTINAIYDIQTQSFNWIKDPLTYRFGPKVVKLNESNVLIMNGSLYYPQSYFLYDKKCDIRYTSAELLNIDGENN